MLVGSLAFSFFSGELLSGEIGLWAGALIALVMENGRLVSRGLSAGSVAGVRAFTGYNMVK